MISLSITSSIFFVFEFETYKVDMQIIVIIYFRSTIQSEGRDGRCEAGAAREEAARDTHHDRLTIHPDISWCRCVRCEVRV